MTNSIREPNRLLCTDTAELPHPEPLRTASISHANGATHLPPPGSSLPNVADSGRISFGAGLRLRPGK